jgi:hypothetical protein
VFFAYPFFWVRFLWCSITVVSFYTTQTPHNQTLANHWSNSVWSEFSSNRSVWNFSRIPERWGGWLPTSVESIGSPFNFTTCFTINVSQLFDPMDQLANLSQQCPTPAGSDLQSGIINGVEQSDHQTEAGLKVGLSGGCHSVRAPWFPFWFLDLERHQRQQMFNSTAKSLTHVQSRQTLIVQSKTVVGLSRGSLKAG